MVSCKWSVETKTKAEAKQRRRWGTERGEFEGLAEEFLRVLENERNASAHTVRAYRREVGNFADYLNETLGAGAQIAAVEHLHIRGYLGQLYGAGWARQARRARWRRCGRGSGGWRRSTRSRRTRHCW